MVTLGGAWAFVAASSVVFIASAWMLNPLCGWLSPLALAIVFFYSLTKRFTWTSQFWLGLSLAVAPVGAWLAVTGYFDWRIVPLAAAVVLWVTGFDIFYACLDVEFDRAEGLRSVPSRWGLRGGILLARTLHALTAALLIGLYWLFPLGPAYLVGAFVCTAVLAIEDALVRPNDLSRAMTAFNLNGIVSLIFFLAVLAGIVWR
jgi:4-hydroxybenzoate polyprenyltransferase